MTTNNVVLNELIKLREQVFGRDNAYSDELAEETGLEEEPQRETETNDAYKARQERVKARKERLGVKERKETKETEPTKPEVKK